MMHRHLLFVSWLLWYWVAIPLTWETRGRERERERGKNVSTSKVSLVSFAGLIFKPFLWFHRHAICLYTYSVYVYKSYMLTLIPFIFFIWSAFNWQRFLSLVFLLHYAVKSLCVFILISHLIFLLLPPCFTVGCVVRNHYHDWVFLLRGFFRACYNTIIWLFLAFAISLSKFS